MPSQLERGKISPEFRAVLWSHVRQMLERHRDHTPPGTVFLQEPWATILAQAHIYRDHQLDDFPTNYDAVFRKVKSRIEMAEWSECSLEWIFKHPRCPPVFPQHVDSIMAHCRLAYRVFDNPVICPVGSDAEREAINRAFGDLAAAEFHGAKKHLRNAAHALKRR
jgi:hypothetical protein